jgi:hypothetical protein
MPAMPLHWGWFAAVEGIEGGHWLSPGEASKIVNVQPKTLANWAKQGVISYIHWGKVHTTGICARSLKRSFRLSIPHPIYG